MNDQQNPPAKKCLKKTIIISFAGLFGLCVVFYNFAPVKITHTLTQKVAKVPIARIRYLIAQSSLDISIPWQNFRIGKPEQVHEQDRSGLELIVYPAKPTAHTGEVVLISVVGTKDENGLGKVTYSWRTLSGKIVSEGSNAKLDTSNIEPGTFVEIFVKAINESGKEVASGKTSIIMELPPPSEACDLKTRRNHIKISYHLPPQVKIAIERREGITESKIISTERDLYPKICVGEKVQLRAIWNGDTKDKYTFQWTSRGGLVIGNGDNAVFITDGLRPGGYTIIVRLSNNNKQTTKDWVNVWLRNCHSQVVAVLLDIGENRRLNAAVLAAFFAFDDEVSESNMASRFV